MTHCMCVCVYCRMLLLFACVCWQSRSGKGEVVVKGAWLYNLIPFVSVYFCKPVCGCGGGMCLCLPPVYRTYLSYSFSLSEQLQWVQKICCGRRTVCRAPLPVEPHKVLQVVEWEQVRERWRRRRQAQGVEGGGSEQQWPWDTSSALLNTVRMLSS